MNLYRIRHVIGRDNLHRIRITSTVNGQNVGNSGEGFNDKQEAIANAGRCFRAFLEAAGFPEPLVLITVGMLENSLDDIPTVDERITNDPLEPQTPEN